MNTDCTQTVFQTQNIYITFKKIRGRHFLKSTRFEDGAIYFQMDEEVYIHVFMQYLEDEIELEEMIKEIERKREIYTKE